MVLFIHKISQGKITKSKLKRVCVILPKVVLITYILKVLHTILRFFKADIDAALKTLKLKKPEKNFPDFYLVSN